MTENDSRLTRRAFAGAAAFMIVPRHVLGKGFVAPSDKINLATIGVGRQGLAVTMDLLARPDIQVTAVCDCNKGSKDYAEYGNNAMVLMARQLFGPGYETWGEDLASPGRVQLTAAFSTSLGMGGRDPAQRVVETYYASRKQSGTYKGCGNYRDYREVLDRKDVDAVYVATPDHWHAPISIAAMRKGKHVLCQKPMTHSVGEARRMAQVARETKVATSLPVVNPSSEPTRIISEWLADGAIGTVREIHNWSSRPYWPQGIPRPAETMAVPEGFDWDMWLGPAAFRPYNKAYAPFVWRGWVDFGCGSFGDMGCYSFAGLFKILNLTPPVAVETCTSELFDETYPKASIVHLDFPANAGRAPVRLSWYDGGLRPPRPAGLKPEDERYFRPNEEGIMYVGDKGYLLAGFNGNGPKVYPESSKYRTPPPPAPGERRREIAIEQWIAACKGGPAPLANFEIQNPVTEAFLLGCISQRIPGERLEWDTAAMKVKNSEKANALLDPPYRSGFTY